MTARLCLIAVAALLSACSGNKRLPGDNEPTLATLRDRTVAVVPDPSETRTSARSVVAEEETIAAYKEFLAAAPKAPQRPEAMRRLGDLEMDKADRQSADSAAADVPDYKTAIAKYEDYLKTYPDEAHFRRGEMLFATRQYKEAESAYATVLAGGNRTPFTERALYMQGWSLYKLGQTEEALKPFFAVLDLKLGGISPAQRDEANLEDIRGLTRADRELLDDSFRVISISLASQQGASVSPSSALAASAVSSGAEPRISG